jgi:hypothetical protein
MSSGEKHLPYGKTLAFNLVELRFKPLWLTDLS